MCLIIGHRGARGEQPENTLQAFRHAARLKIPVETDIAMTADFIPVMHHDPMRPDGRLIRDLPFAALRNIPSLAESLAALPEQEWFLEIKTYPPEPERSHPPSAIVSQVMRTLQHTGTNLSRVAIKAFDWDVLREVALQNPALRRIALTAPDTEAARELWWGRGFAAATAPEAIAAAGAHAWSAFHETLTAAQIRQAKALGLKIFAWTVNDAAEFHRLAPLVDGLITDYPARLLGLKRHP